MIKRTEKKGLPGIKSYARCTRPWKGLVLVAILFSSMAITGAILPIIAGNESKCLDNPRPLHEGAAWNETTVAPSDSTPADIVDLHAVVVGVSDYPGTAYDLSYCHKDAHDVRNLLVNRFNVPSSQIQVLVNNQATSSNIASAISNAAATMDDNDFFFFYFSGHGGEDYTTTSHTWNIESPHPYPNNYDQYWNFHVPGADLMRVHFTRINTERYYDYVFVGDNAQRQYYYDFFTGSYPSGAWSAWVPTDDIYVNLYSDHSITDWGFSVDRVEAVYFTGLYSIIPHDGLSQGMTNSHLETLLADVPGTSIIVLDTCNAGGFGELLDHSNRYILTSCRADEYSIEDPHAQNGVFTSKFLEAWYYSGTIDTNNDGAISFQEKFPRIYQNTVSRSTQLGLRHRPQQYDGIGGPLILDPNVKITDLFGNATTGAATVLFNHNGLGHGSIKVTYIEMNSRRGEVVHEQIILPQVGPQLMEFQKPSPDYNPWGVGIELTTQYNGIQETAKLGMKFMGGMVSDDIDSDNDGLSDYDEIFIYFTDPLNPDTDGDGLTDYEEIFIYFTDPLNPDTSGNGFSDGLEVMLGHDPLNPFDSPAIHLVMIPTFAGFIALIPVIIRASAKKKRNYTLPKKPTSNITKTVRIRKETMADTLNFVAVDHSPTFQRPYTGPTGTMGPELPPLPPFAEEALIRMGIEYMDPFQQYQLRALMWKKLLE